MLSFDAAWCYYAYFPNLQQSELNYQRRDLPYQGSDIYRIHLQTREVQQLTFQEFTPNLGAGNWDETNPVNPPSGYNRLGYGILNLGPCPVPGGKVAFVSNRNAYWPTKSFTAPTLQLLVMDEDGENVEHIAPMTIGSALHPTILRDGRLMFSTYESQGLRDRRLWGIWTIYPDGRHWAPMVSAFRSPQAFHFMTQLSNEDTVVVDYYNLNNNGFGAMYRFPVQPPAGMPGFYGAFPADNPPIDQTVSGGFSYPFKMPFTPYGMYSITPFTHGNDNAAPIGEDRSIVHIDSKQMQTNRIVLRFKDKSPATNHVVIGQTSLTEMGELCTVENYVEEPNHIRRLEILLPPSLGSTYFLHVDTP